MIAILLTLSVQTLTLSAHKCDDMPMQESAQMHMAHHISEPISHSETMGMMQDTSLEDCCDSECKCPHNINSTYLSLLSFKLDFRILAYPGSIIYKPVFFQSNQDKSLYRPPIFA